MLFAGLGSVLIAKNCDLGLENAFKTSVTVSHYTDLQAGK